MKQSDIFTIVIIATVGTIAAFILVNNWLGDPDLRSVTFDTIDPVVSTLKEPDPELFNVDAINPTVEVYVGQCEDIDQNGILDSAEQAICNNAASANTNNADNANNTQVQTTIDANGNVIITPVSETQNNLNNDTMQQNLQNDNSLLPNVQVNTSTQQSLQTNGNGEQ